MFKYEVPLQVVTYSYEQGGNQVSHIDFEKLSIARMLFDGMGEDELYEDAPISPDELKRILRSFPSMSIEDHFDRLLDSGFHHRFSTIDIEAESQNVPKNYDVALALAAGGRLKEARDVMDYLRAIDPKDPLDLSNFRTLERISRLINELVEERLHLEVEDGRDELRESFKAAFFEDTQE